MSENGAAPAEQALGVLTTVQSEDQFHECISRPGLTVVLWSCASWSSPSKKAARLLQDLAQKHVATFVHLDIDDGDNEALATLCNVQGEPEWQFYRAGDLLEKFLSCSEERVVASLCRYS